MKFKHLAILILFFLTTGCWNYTELNELSIVKGVSIDFEENQYVVNYMISNASSEKKSNETTPQTAVLEGKGQTISDAISKIKLISPKKIYIGHMLVLVISEDVAKKGIATATDYFFRNTNSKGAFQVAIARNTKAKDTLKMLSPLDSFPSDNITKNLATAESFSAFVSNTTFVSFIRKIKDKGIDASANGIAVIGSSKKGSTEETLKNAAIENYIRIEPLAIFKDDKLINWADEDISKGINILLSSAKELKLTIPYNNGHISFLLTNLKLKSNFNIDKIITFYFDIETNSEIDEMTVFVDTKKENIIKDLEKEIVKNLEKILNKTIQFLQKNKSDAIGLGYRIYINDYNNWIKFKNDWNNYYFQKTKVNFKIKTNLLKEEDTNEGAVNLKNE